MDAWYELGKFRCPIDGCAGSNKEKNWYCDDGGVLYISQFGKLQCRSGGISDHHGLISKWRFDCGEHGDHPRHRFKAPDFTGFNFALSSAVDLLKRSGATWTGQLCVELLRQFEGRGKEEDLQDTLTASTTRQRTEEWRMVSRTTEIYVKHAYPNQK